MIEGLEKGSELDKILSERNRIPFIANRCDTIQDVIVKYTSLECRAHYSSELIEHWGGGTDDIPKESMVFINNMLVNDIQSDIQAVFSNEYRKVLKYITDLTCNGILEKLSLESINNIQKITLDIAAVASSNLTSPPQTYILTDELASDSPYGHGAIANRLVQFHLKKDLVYKRICPYIDMLNSYWTKIYSAISGSALDYAKARIRKSSKGITKNKKE